MPCILDIVRQTSNPVGRHYTRSLAENAPTDDQPHTTMLAPQSEKRLWFPRHNERGFILRDDYCGSWVSLASDYRAAIGMHLTWLSCNAGMWTRKERRYLGRKKGGVVRLWPDECVTYGLGIAEGIETALSAAHVFAPVWAALDAGNLSSFPVLGGIEALTVFADHDESGVGERSAVACAERWLNAGRAVRVIMPGRVGADMCDLDMEAA